MKVDLPKTGLVLITAAVMTACGGGDKAKSPISNKVTPHEEITVRPGEAVFVEAQAHSQIAGIKKMVWTAKPLYIASSDTITPYFSDPECESGSRIVGRDSATGHCRNVVVVRPGTETSKWAISNTAETNKGDIWTDEFVLSVDGSKSVAGNFSVKSPAKPLFVNKDELAQVTGSISVDPGSEVRNLRYEWSILEGSKTFRLAGNDQTTVSFYPTGTGESVLRFRSWATVNGHAQESVGTYIVIIQDPARTNVGIEAGAVQKVEPENIVSLNGIVKAPSASSIYYEWKQTGGPEVLLANSQSERASFFAKDEGTYVFQLTAKAIISGETIERTAQTAVYVAKKPEPKPTAGAGGAGGGTNPPPNP